VAAVVGDMTRPIEEFEEAMRLVRWGMNDCQISNLMGVPRTTVKGWRKKLRRDPRWAPGNFERANDCPFCGSGHVNPEAYAYLLGMYLGDGHIVHQARTTKLGISLDAKYPGIIYECTEAVAGQRECGVMKVGLQSYDTWVLVTGHWQHWPCLFPQHGPGLKHKRKIELVDWQVDVVDAHPELLLRGLIHSDGCRFINPVKRQWKDGPVKLYKYPRYMFTNASDDIRRIFCEACDRLEIEWKQSNWRTISVARRDSVARMDEFVGPKR
jgi:hypothetical protein